MGVSLFSMKARNRVSICPKSAMKNESIKAASMAPVSCLFGAIFLSLAFFCGNAAEPASDQESQTEKLAKETQNPVANLISASIEWSAPRG